MAQDWYYKLLGEETGPVTFEALRELARDGHLTVDDEVRTSTSSWKPVADVPSLYVDGDVEEPELATDMDLDMLMAPSSSMPMKVSAKREAQRAAIAAAAAPPPPVAEWYYKVLGQEMGPTTPDEVTQQIKDGALQGNDTVRQGRDGAWKILSSTPQFSALITQMQPKPEWYCRMLGQELGPMTFDELQAMAKSRSLNTDDEVRHGTAEPWANADRIRGLKFPKAAAVTEATAHDRNSTLAPFGEAALKREWYYEILAQSMGPISFKSMAKAVADGSLKFEDRARRGMSGAWSLVMDVPGLVSIEDKAAYLAAKVEASRPKPAPPPPAPVAIAAVAVAAPVPATLAPVPVPNPTPPMPMPASPPPQAAASGGYGASGATGGGYGSMASGGRPAGFPPGGFKPPKKSGGGFSLNDLKEKLDAKAIAAIAVILLVVGGYFALPMLGITFSKPAGLAEYSQVNTLWLDVKSMHTKKVKQKDWDAWKGENGGTIENLLKQIKDQKPSSAKKLLMLMQKCTKDHLPKIMANGKDAEGAFKSMEKDMKEAQKIATGKAK